MTMGSDRPGQYFGWPVGFGQADTLRGGDYRNRLLRVCIVLKMHDAPIVIQGILTPSVRSCQFSSVIKVCFSHGMWREQVGGGGWRRGAFPA